MGLPRPVARRSTTQLTSVQKVGLHSHARVTHGFASLRSPPLLTSERRRRLPTQSSKPRGARLAIMQRFRHVRFLARRLCSGSLNEFRHNLATDEWVVFSSARRSRPTQIVSNDLKAPQISLLGAHDVNCPFCKGNEHLTPPATYTRYERGTKDWIMRVVPNKFPAVSPASPSSPPRVEAVAAGDPYLQFTVDRIEATGFHEVLIEGPAHNVPTALASPSQVESLVRGLRSRGRSMIASDSSLRHIMCK